MAKKKGKKKAAKLIGKKTQDRRLGRKEIRQIAKRTGRTKAEIRNQATKINKNLKPKKQFTIKPTVRSQAKNFLARKGKDENLSKKDIRRFDKRFGELRGADKIVKNFLDKNPDIRYKGMTPGLGTDLKIQADTIPTKLPTADPIPTFTTTNITETPTINQTMDTTELDKRLAELKAYADSFMREEGQIAMTDNTFVGGRNAGGVRFRRRKNRKALGMGTGQLKRSVRNQGLQMNPVNV